jgi:hypothetical protein
VACLPRARIAQIEDGERIAALLNCALNSGHRPRSQSFIHLLRWMINVPQKLTKVRIVHSFAAQYYYRYELNPQRSHGSTLPRANRAESFEESEAFALHLIQK